MICYTLYLGLDKEYELLQSEEFAERIQDITNDDVTVDKPRFEVVTDIWEDLESADD